MALHHPTLNYGSLSNSNSRHSSSAVVHFSTLSADLRRQHLSDPVQSTQSLRTTLSLLEQDTGAPDDFYSIRLDLILRPRRGVASSSSSSSSSSSLVGAPQDDIIIPIDDILTLRHQRSPSPACVSLHGRGAIPLGSISFPDGPEVCQSFILALRAHATFTILPDPHHPGTLYAVEPKPRMRRAAPSLMPLYFPQPSSLPQPPKPSASNPTTTTSTTSSTTTTTTATATTTNSTASNSYPSPTETASHSTTTKSKREQEDDEFSALLSDLNISSSSKNKSKASSSSISSKVQRDKEFYQSNQNPAHVFTMGLLSQFARVTQVARDIGDHIAKMADEENRRALFNQQSDAASHLQATALDIHATITASTDVENELPPRLKLEESNSVPVDLPAWEAAMKAGRNGQIDDARVMRYAILVGGVTSTVRSQVWPFLLGVYQWRSTSNERSNTLKRLQSEYTALKNRTDRATASAELADKISLEKEEEEEEKLSEKEGSPSEGKENGNSSATTTTLTTTEKKVLAKRIPKRDRSARLHREDDTLLQVREQIAKDVIRTDRHLPLYSPDDSPSLKTMSTILTVYATYNPSIGYCQGMSDFLAPLIHEIGTSGGSNDSNVQNEQNEALLFWCFERLMRRMEANFRLDQSGMHTQLRLLKRIVTVADEEVAKFFEETDPQFYSCFRWLVVRFKREMKFHDVARLWEILWVRETQEDEKGGGTEEKEGREMHVYVAAGLLLAHKQRLLSLEKGAFDVLLRYINDMSMRIDVEFALHEGEACFTKFHDAVSSQ